MNSLKIPFLLWLTTVTAWSTPASNTFTQVATIEGKLSLLDGVFSQVKAVEKE